MIILQHSSGILPLARIHTVYFYSTIESFLPRYCVVIVCYATRLFMCCLSVFVCAALFFLFGLLRPLPQIWPGLALPAACFVLSLFWFPIKKMPSPSRPTRTARSSSPLGPVRLLHTANVASTSTSSPTTTAATSSSFITTTMTSCPPIRTVPSIVTNSIMVLGITKAVSQAVIQSLTPFILRASYVSSLCLILVTWTFFVVDRRPRNV